MTLNRASKIDGSDNQEDSLYHPGLMHELSKTHVDGFRKEVNDLESLIDKQSKQTAKIMTSLEDGSKLNSRATPIITDFNKTMLSGFRSKMQKQSDLQPSCFCEKTGNCKKH